MPQSHTALQSPTLRQADVLAPIFWHVHVLFIWQALVHHISSLKEAFYPLDGGSVSSSRAVDLGVMIAMFRKLTHPLMALTLATAMTATSVQPAEAGRGGRTAAFITGTIIGLGLAGAIAHGRTYGGCYKGRLRCEWVKGPCYYNKYGDYVCRRGHERCWRPTYCD